MTLHFDGNRKKKHKNNPRPSPAAFQFSFFKPISTLYAYLKKS